MLIFMLAAALSATPAESAIHRAKAEIAAHPDYAAGYAHLARAYTRRARETGDAELLDSADSAVRKGLELSPEDFETRKASVEVSLGRHEWQRALEIAKQLNRQTPDDISVYGYMADAQIALGDFRAAIENTEWMLRIRPGNAAGLTRAARLRELYHDWSGALDALQAAYDATPFADSDERAAIEREITRVTAESAASRQ